MPPAPLNSAEAWNAKCDGYRDEIAATVSAAGRTLRPDEQAQLQAAGGFMAEHGGDVDAALTSAVRAAHPAVGVLTHHLVALRALSAQRSAA